MVLKPNASLVRISVLLIFGLLFGVVVQGFALPEGVSPSTVFSKIDSVNQNLTQLLKVKNIHTWQKTQKIDTQVKPMHVYQMQLASVQLMYEYEIKAGLRPIPIMIATPIKYYPADVLMISQSLKTHVDKLLKANNLTPLNSSTVYTNKTPGDVFAKSLEVFSKLAALNGIKKITPTQVYEQINRATRDLQTMLLELALNSKYKLTRQQKIFLISSTQGSHPDGTQVHIVSEKKIPKQVFLNILKIRTSLNKLRIKMGLRPVPVPHAKGLVLNPVDVFAQTQIVIAELNLLKIPFNLATATPTKVKVHNKTPTNVFQQTVLIQYMLKRLNSMPTLLSQLRKQYATMMKPKA